MLSFKTTFFNALLYFSLIRLSVLQTPNCFDCLKSNPSINPIHLYHHKTKICKSEDVSLQYVRAIDLETHVKLSYDVYYLKYTWTKEGTIKLHYTGNFTSTNMNFFSTNFYKCTDLKTFCIRVIYYENEENAKMTLTHQAVIMQVVFVACITISVLSSISVLSCIVLLVNVQCKKKRKSSNENDPYVYSQAFDAYTKRINDQRRFSTPEFETDTSTDTSSSKNNILSIQQRVLPVTPVEYIYEEIPVQKR